MVSGRRPEDAVCVYVSSNALGRVGTMPGLLVCPNTERAMCLRWLKGLKEQRCGWVRFEVLRRVTAVESDVFCFELDLCVVYWQLNVYLQPSNVSTETKLQK